MWHARPVRWFVYLARCSDGTLYCGITNDVPARLAAHNAGKGAKYTRTRGPIELLAVRMCRTKGRALQLEYRVKQLTRAQKQELVATPSKFMALARSIVTRTASRPPTSRRGSRARSASAPSAAPPSAR